MSPPVPWAEQWSEVEILLWATRRYDRPYTDVEVHVDFEAPDGRVIRRPAFWDGGDAWRVRFTSPIATGRWSWRSSSTEARDAGLHGKRGVLHARPSWRRQPLLRHGLLRMSPDGRSVVHADGRPFFMVADTPWAMLWRATEAEVLHYAGFRQRQGFNAALLMTMMPHQQIRGPRLRGVDAGFDVAFRDLGAGHLNDLDVAYFQTVDRLLSLLLEHGIVPVLQPLSSGSRARRDRTSRLELDPDECARYAKYLVARYGARPALWLVAGHASGSDPCVQAAATAIERWDAYQQPTGLHLDPACDPPPVGSDWLDFVWVNTGHDGAHRPDVVSAMADRCGRAVANGEPTYEGLPDARGAGGWWQGEEAWMNLTAGGTMGVVYGAAGLWSWRLSRDEHGWAPWADEGLRWADALALPGARFVGWVGAALAEYDTTDLARVALPDGSPCVGRAGHLYVVYLARGGRTKLPQDAAALPVRWLDPRAGRWFSAGGGGCQLDAPSSAPWVAVAGAPDRHS